MVEIPQSNAVGGGRRRLRQDALLARRCPGAVESADRVLMARHHRAGALDEQAAITALPEQKNSWQDRWPVVS
jgi:hypothetical protein